MLRFASVLLLAQCALGAQVLQLSTVRWSPSPVSSSGLVSRSVIENAFGIKDAGETNIYILTVQQILDDMAEQSDPLSQVMALSQAISLLGEVSTGLPGDACSYAELIRASSGKGDVKLALRQYVQTVSRGIDNILSLANSQESVWTTIPSAAVCSDYGRWYDIDTVWTNIIRGYPLDASLLNEAYCAARRLANAWNVRSNNVGAAITAAVTPAALNVWTLASKEASAFLRDIANDNLSSAIVSANNLKAALASAC